MKPIVPLAALAILAACSEPPPPPAPPKPAMQVQSPAPAPAPAAAAPAPEAPKAAEEAPQPDPNKVLATRVKQALDAPDSKLPSGAIDVTAADGKVTLWGALPSQRDVRRASQVAGKVQGVKSVDNQLKIVKGS